MIGGFIAIIVGASLLGPLSDQVYLITHNSSGDGLTNVTGWAGTVSALTTGFFALSLMGVGVGVLYSTLRAAGVF